MHGPGPAEAARFGSGVIDVKRTARIPPGLVCVITRALETECLGQERMACATTAFESPHAGEPLQGELLGNLGMSRHERLILSRAGDELETETLRVFEPETVVFDRGFQPGRLQAPRPELEGFLGTHPKADPMDHPRARTSAHEAWILEKCQVRTGAAIFVSVEEVVDGRVVLVDRLLDQSQAHDPGIELEVPGCVGGDGADVVDSVQWVHVRYFPTQVPVDFVPPRM